MCISDSHFLCQLHLNKLSGRTRRTTIASQSEAFGKQVKLFGLHLNAAIFGQLIDNHQIFVTLWYREGNLQTETIGQRGHRLKRIAAMYVITLTIGKPLPNQMTAIGCCIQDQIVRLASQAALNKRFQCCKIFVFSFKRQVKMCIRDSPTTLRELISSDTSKYGGRDVTNDWVIYSDDHNRAQIILAPLGSYIFRVTQ